jgi:hypothetical protein
MFNALGSLPELYLDSGTFSRVYSSIDGTSEILLIT